MASRIAIGASMSIHETNTFFIALPFLGLMWMLKNIGFATAATLREDIPAMLEFSLWVIDGVLVWITGPPEWATLTALAICAIAYVLSLLNSQHAKHSVLGLLQKERREFEYRQIMSDDFVRQMKRSAMAKRFWMKPIGARSSIRNALIHTSPLHIGFKKSRINFRAGPFFSEKTFIGRYNAPVKWRRTEPLR